MWDSNFLHLVTVAFIIQHVRECSVKRQNEHKLCRINVLKCLAERLGIMTKNKLSFCWHVTKKQKKRKNKKFHDNRVSKIHGNQIIDISVKGIMVGLTVLSSLLQVCLLLQMISLLPARVIKLLEFIGFSGSKVSSYVSKHIL